MPSLARIGPRDSERFCRLELSGEEFEALLRAVEIVDCHDWFQAGGETPLRPLRRRLAAFDREDRQ